MIMKTNLVKPQRKLPIKLYALVKYYLKIKIQIIYLKTFELYENK